MSVASDALALAEYVPLGSTLLATVGACLFLSGSTCLYPWLDANDPAVIQLTIASSLYLITSSVRLILTVLVRRLPMPRRQNRKLLRELAQAVVECVGGALLVPGCVLLFSRFSQREETIGNIVFAVGCLLYGTGALLGLLFSTNENVTENADSGNQACSSRCMFVCYIIGNGCLVAACILHLPSTDKKTAGASMFVVGSVTLIGAESMHVYLRGHQLARRTEQHSANNMELQERDQIQRRLSSIAITSV